MKRMFACCLLIWICAAHAGAAALQPFERIVQDEMKYLSEDNHTAYSRLWMRSRQNEVLFLHSPKERNSVYNIEAAAVTHIKELPQQLAASCLPRLSHYIAHFGLNNVKVMYIGADYKVKQENYFQLNGGNYLLQVFVKERGVWRIAESTVAPTDRIMAMGYGFNTEDESTYIERREALR